MYVYWPGGIYNKHEKCVVSDIIFIRVLKCQILIRVYWLFSNMALL